MSETRTRLSSYLEEPEAKQMPEEFDDCVEAGGKVRTQTLGGGKYVKWCLPPGADEKKGWIRGHEQKKVSKEMELDQ